MTTDLFERICQHTQAEPAERDRLLIGLLDAVLRTLDEVNEVNEPDRSASGGVVEYEVDEAVDLVRQDEVVGSRRTGAAWRTSSTT